MSERLLEDNVSSLKHQSSTKEIVEYVSKIAAILAGTVYATGFFIVSIHYARFGIIEMDLFRPKLFMAGGTFVLLVLVGMVAASRTYGIFGLRHDSIYKTGISSDAQSETHLNVFLNLAFIRQQPDWPSFSTLFSGPTAHRYCPIGESDSCLRSFLLLWSLLTGPESPA